MNSDYAVLLISFLVVVACWGVNAFITRPGQARRNSTMNEERYSGMTEAMSGRRLAVDLASLLERADEGALYVQPRTNYDGYLYYEIGALDGTERIFAEVRGRNVGDNGPWEAFDIATDALTEDTEMRSFVVKQCPNESVHTEHIWCIFGSSGAGSRFCRGLKA